MVMIYLDFQRDTEPHNFHVCAAFFKTVRECHNAVLQIHHWIITIYYVTCYVHLIAKCENLFSFITYWYIEIVPK